MNLTEMKTMLAEAGIQLTKSLGQNFLHDANQIRRIVDAAALAEDDRVLEIGPGLGPLTEWLVAHTREVLAIEIDRRLFACLQKRFVAVRNLTLLQADALDYLDRHPRDWTEWKLVANLPYSVASPLLVELARMVAGPRKLVVTLQLEVARRLMAKAGEDGYGVLTLLVQLNYEPVGWFKIPPGCFFPEPDVDSACVMMDRRVVPLLPPGAWPAFVSLVKRGFSQRRKMMLKLLKRDWPEEALASAYTQLNLSPQIRAEKLTVGQFAQLAMILGPPAG